MKVRGGRGKEALYLCCVTEGSAAAVIEDGLKEDVLDRRYFNVRVGRSRDFWRTLNELELVICNGRRCVSEAEPRPEVSH